MGLPALRTSHLFVLTLLCPLIEAVEVENMSTRQTQRIVHRCNMVQTNVAWLFFLLVHQEPKFYVETVVEKKTDQEHGAREN
jgi:hypothetical protein